MKRKVALLLGMVLILVFAFNTVALAVGSSVNRTVGGVLINGSTGVRTSPSKGFRSKNTAPTTVYYMKVYCDAYAGIGNWVQEVSAETSNTSSCTTPYTTKVEAATGAAPNCGNGTHKATNNGASATWYTELIA